ncbi:ABC transporter ATP-binding protein, partial [Lactobacillus gasseri]|nr:ABC transporter ATP-binding protein [Lactobacillus gasseri]
AISWILQIIFDYMAGKGPHSLATILLLVVSFMLVISLIFALKRSAYPRFLEKAMNQYKEAVIKKLFKKSYSDFLITNSGTYLSVLT